MIARVHGDQGFIDLRLKRGEWQIIGHVRKRIFELARHFVNAQKTFDGPKVQKARQPQAIDITLKKGRQQKDHNDDKKGSHLSVRKGKGRVGNFARLIVSHATIAHVLIEPTQQGVMRLAHATVQNFAADKFLQPQGAQGDAGGRTPRPMEPLHFVVRNAAQHEKWTGGIVEGVLSFAATESEAKVDHLPKATLGAVFSAFVFGQFVGVDGRPGFTGNVFFNGCFAAFQIIAQGGECHARQERDQVGQFLRKERGRGHAHGARLNNAHGALCGKVLML
mmetsp:Transcript_8811/g.24388  ORF Transcript_8811/g.24388 Transcript_8811/m.24388 type:complete len:278 (-) Transcript_8811:989-1822(-)